MLQNFRILYRYLVFRVEILLQQQYFTNRKIHITVKYVVFNYVLKSILSKFFISYLRSFCCQLFCLLLVVDQGFSTLFILGGIFKMTIE